MREARKGDLALIVGCRDVGNSRYVGTICQVTSDPFLANTKGSVSKKPLGLNRVCWIIACDGFKATCSVKHLIPLLDRDPDAQTTRTKEREHV